MVDEPTEEFCLCVQGFVRPPAAGAGGAVVSIAASQAADLGSIPGQRMKRLCRLS